MRRLRIPRSVLCVLGASATMIASTPPVEVGDDECIDCFSCFGPFGWGHQTSSFAPVFNNTYGEHGLHNTTCESGSCEWEHPPSAECWNGGNEEVQQLAAHLPDVLEAVRSRDLGALYSLASSPNSGSRITYNVQRQAVQVVGCEGAIVAHIPLTQAMTTDAAEHLERMVEMIADAQ